MDATPTQPDSPAAARPLRPAKVVFLSMLFLAALAVVPFVVGWRDDAASTEVVVRPAIEIDGTLELTYDVDQDIPGGGIVPAALRPRAVPPSDGDRNFRVVETILLEVTAYCPCTRCCGPQAQGLTASGKPVAYNEGRFAAADTRLLPFGTMLRVPGYHDMSVIEVTDRGGAIKGHKLDVYFPDHETALRWGRQMLPVQVIEMAD